MAYYLNIVSLSTAVLAILAWEDPSIDDGHWTPSSILPRGSQNNSDAKKLPSFSELDNPALKHFNETLLAKIFSQENLVCKTFLTEVVAAEL